MKNIIKILAVVMLVAVFGCEDDDGRFSNDPTTGWVAFRSAQTTTAQVADMVTIPIDVRVPVYKDGLSINYTIVPITGDVSLFVSSTTGTIVMDPSIPNTTSTPYNRYAEIIIPLMNTEAGRNFVTSFDVVLTSTSAPGVKIGLDETSIIKHRVTIPCSNPEVIPADYFVGNYVIADQMATIGPGNGTENFQNSVITLTIDPSDPNSRLFTVRVLPAFVATPRNGKITFGTDNKVVLANLGTGIGCAGPTGPQFSYGSAGSNNSPWDVCNDENITINYTEDINVSCGGPYMSSFTLTAN